jgi:Thermolysin metallopeptidase, alpha-helical domain/Thermolysin metallopeptidase, catalytic domain
MQPRNCGCCFFIPPNILRKLATSIDPHVASTAARSLQLGKTLRLVRSQLSTGAPSPTVPVRTGLREQVFTCDNTVDLPGDQVRTEKGAPASDDTANQAFENVKTSWSFYNEIFGRESVDGHGLALVSSVHYDQNYDNALWNGQQMIYGDGDGTTFRGFAGALDVIGHELTHGVTQFTAQLPYQGQAGALNESMSDVFGSMVKQWSKGQTVDQADWLIGADIFTPSFKGRALRDMANPGTAYDDPTFGKDQQPAHMRDYVQMDPDDDNGGVHVNSGIPNKAFYLAAKAIGGKAWEVTGKIWYVTLTERLTSSADFAKCANATISVARDLFPSDSTIASRVAQAWVDVGVLQQSDALIASITLSSTQAAALMAVSPQAVFTIRHGHRYAATVVLSGVEQFSSDDDIANRLKQYGFIDVVVTGSGLTRRAEATWNDTDTTVQVDSHLRDIVEVVAPAPAVASTTSAAAQTAPVLSAQTVFAPTAPTASAVTDGVRASAPPGQSSASHRKGAGKRKSRMVPASGAPPAGPNQPI